MGRITKGMETLFGQMADATQNLSKRINNNSLTKIISRYVSPIIIPIYIFVADLLFRVYTKLQGGKRSITVDGITTDFYCTTRTEYHTFTENFKEERGVISDIIKQTSKNDTVYDIGANVGTYTCIIKNAVPECNIVAFEPFPNNVDRLEENLDLNGVDATIREVALSDYEGEGELNLSNRLDFKVNEASSGAHSLVENHFWHMASDGPSINVDVRTVDSMVEDNDVPIPNIVKIDAEGVELQILEGMRNTLSKQECRLVWVEWHLGYGKNEISEILEQEGFDTEVKEFHGKEFIRGSKGS